MKEVGYLLKDEGSVEDFLGVHIKEFLGSHCRPCFEMTQTSLINKILNDLGLSNDFVKKLGTPANQILFPDLNEEAYDGASNYRSVIGKLNFLALNTRPDIAFAVHQCARFCQNPRVTYGAVVKKLVNIFMGHKTRV